MLDSVRPGSTRGLNLRTVPRALILLGGIITQWSCSSSTEPVRDIDAPAPGPVAAIVAVSGDWQGGRTGSQLPEPLRVRAVDALGNPIAGARVTFTVISGGGTLGGVAALTASNGVAESGVWTLGPAAGAQQVRAEADAAHVLLTAEACQPEQCPRLLFVRENDIYAWVDGVIRRLTFDGRSFHPAWSSDGGRIAFARHGPGVPRPVDVFTMDADGSKVELRTSGKPFHSPAWSPDGQALALAGDWWSCVYECSIYRLDLSTPGALPRFLAPMGAEPAWSPDGTKIVFVSLSGDDGYHALNVVNADGTGLTTVVPRGQGAINRPAWSPDGSRIAFSKCLGGSCAIYLVAPDGSNLTPLETLGSAVGAAWSPDASSIAFTRWSYAGGAVSYSIEYVKIEGGNPIRLLSNAHSPAWHP